MPQDSDHPLSLTLLENCLKFASLYRLAAVEKGPFTITRKRAKMPRAISEEGRAAAVVVRRREGMPRRSLAHCQSSSLGMEDRVAVVFMV